MTIDVEDYFHVTAFASDVDRAKWSSLESRVENNTLRLLDLFARHDVRATFFVLGWVAERHGTLVKRLHDAGHEVACHGLTHELVYKQSPETFRKETAYAKALLEDLSGAPVRGYRAATYSIVRESMWALDILEELGFEYDSSIFPVRHDLYGIPDSPRAPYRVASGKLLEVPLTTVAIARPAAAVRRRRILSPAALWAVPLGLAPRQPSRSVVRDFLCAPVGDRSRSAADSRLIAEIALSPLHEPRRHRRPARPATERFPLGPHGRDLRLRPTRTGTSVNAQPLAAGSETAACSVRAFQPADAARWNAFVRPHPEGTFFHLAEWQYVLARRSVTAAIICLLSRVARSAACCRSRRCAASCSATHWFRRRSASMAASSRSTSARMRR